MAKGQVVLKRLTEVEARELLEGLRWKDGKYCPHCGNADAARLSVIKQKEGTTVRAGVHHCKECRKLFTVTVGTIMERTRIPLADWVYAFAAMTASKKGISAHQLGRELGLTYKTAWFLAHRVRFAMGEEHKGLMGGNGKVLEMDETIITGDPRYTHGGTRKISRERKVVVSLVERGGKARSAVLCDVTSATLGDYLNKNADKASDLMTDNYKGYATPGKEFASHGTTAHTLKRYANGKTHSNTVESYFSLLKRGIVGTFHHVSSQHLHRFVAEFDFRWNSRHMNDTERALLALSQITDKRLMYADTKPYEA